MIAGNDGGYDPTKAYTHGKGVLVRNPYDGYEDGGPHKGKGGSYVTLPSTFLSNDIFSSNKVFPRFSNGFDWESPVMVYIIGSAMENMFKDFDIIQGNPKDPSWAWGWGVFYPWDSNAVDFRCEWLDPKGFPQVYNCPGFSKKFHDPKPTADANMFGAGYFQPGNPWANPLWGGGAGCHFSGMPYGCNNPTKCTNDIDQINAYANKDPKYNLVQDPACQCNYLFKDNWAHWVQTLGDMSGHAKNGTLPEAAMCWTNNPRDMINLQNNLFWNRAIWFNTGELGDHGPSGYWGWNEIPMARIGSDGVTNAKNWDAIVIKVPLYTCKGSGGDDHLDCVSAKGRANLETDISKWASDGKLVPGYSHVADRPGSYVVLMREWRDANGNSFSFFFCQQWGSPNGHWQIAWIPMSTSDKYGACYLEKGPNFQESILEGPFDPPISRAEAKFRHRQYSIQRRAAKAANLTVVV
jgi:hypothetical protein